MLIYALVAGDCRETIDLFIRRNDAYGALADVLADEPGFDGWLEVVALDFGQPDPLATARFGEGPLLS